MEKVNVLYFGGGSVDVSVRQHPDDCPRCHRHIDPVRRTSACGKDDDTSEFDMVLQCTNRKCGKLFLAQYREIGIVEGREHYELIKTEPCEMEKREFSEQITTVSPLFSEIYNEAVAAENLGMGHIAGMGFGKALEFLVKDFAIDQQPDKKEEIKGKFLGSCIDEYVADESVKRMAKRAAWLRNDGSHYLRKWMDKDVKDLKILIRLVVNAIENVKLAEKYEGEMK